MPLIIQDGTIPATGHLPSTDYTTIQTNFANNISMWSQDHLPFNSNNNSGLHSQVRMPNYTLSGISVPPTVLAGFGGLYCNNTISTGASTETGLWFTPDASTNKYQLTRTITGSFATLGSATGWSFLPGGLLIQYGIVTGAVGSGNVNFPVPFNNAAFSVTITPIRNSTNVDIVYVQAAANTSGFTYKNTSSSITSFYWMAIGA